MIARILYRESIHGVLNYVLQKSHCTILGLENVSPEMEKYPDLLKYHLHFMGNRNQTKKRYAHITINLPHGEYLTDKNFHGLAQKYMAHMGYAEQPYVVVKHDDTKHEHIHIVTTTVKEDNTLVNLSNDFVRNVATQKHLEKEFGLSPSPDTRSKQELPVHRLPEMQPLPDDSQGVKFYIQDILNTVLQKHKVRSFDELAALVKPYHILISPTKNEGGRIGVSYGIEVKSGYKSRFINGYIVHPNLSGPKMDLKFQQNAKSKLVPIHRKRLAKQLSTTYKLFKTIEPDDLCEILKQYQNIEAQIQYNKKQNITGLTIYDKSGYVFDSSEIDSQIYKNLKQSEKKEYETLLDFEGNQFLLEVRKLIKEALFIQYLNSYKKDRLLSEYLLTKNFNDILPEIRVSKHFQFLSNYSDGKENRLIKTIKSEFEKTRNQLHVIESKKEIELLERKVQMITDVTRSPIIEPSQKDEVLFQLIQSLGTKYSKRQISFINSNTHFISLELGQIHLPNESTAFVSTGFINENEKMLKCLLQTDDASEKSVRANAIFLPIIFPKLYDSMIPVYRERFEQIAMEAYLKTAERFHRQFEKSPEDYIKLFNSKGFYFKKTDDELFIHSIYGKQESTIQLPKKTRAYLMSSSNMANLLSDQHDIIGELKQSGRDKLQNLWASYMIERGLYDKAAFLIVYDGIRPNLLSEEMEHHMNNGLKEKILVLAKQKANSQHRVLLRKSVYAFSALMGKTGQQEEVFNGFRDELTNYSKYRNVFI